MVLVLILAGALFGIGWYYSAQLLDVTHDAKSYPIHVLAVRGNTVELSRDDDALRAGTYGLVWPGGRVVVGRIVSSSDSGVVRVFSGESGGPKAGTDARIDSAVYASPDGFEATFWTVNVRDALGPMPAWYVPGKRATWVILVHGYKSDRTDGLRAMQTFVGLGLPELDISYRNDVGAPQSSDNMYHLGATEWEDVQAAARYAMAHGAKSLLLFGDSLGGSIVEYFMRHSKFAGKVRGVVLDAPVVDWDATLDLRASQKNLPGFLTAVAKRIIAYRLGLSSLEPLNTVDQPGSIRTPTLLFHGTADSSVPFDSSAALARARPGVVTFVPVKGAEHVEAWNVNPSLYDAKLRAFVHRVLR